MKAPRVVLVSGASRGLGRAIAERFLAEGDRVACAFHQRADLAEALAAGSERAIAVRLDLTDRGSIRAALATTREALGEVEVLVNNGAVAQEKPFAELTDDDWDRMLATNLRGPFACTQEVLPAMLERGFGRVINVTSIGGQWGGLNQVHYAAAKAGLINLTRSMAKLYSGRGVTCNAVAPGLVATDMTAAELASEAGRAKVAAIPAGRLGTPAEVADAVYYLSTEAAGYITGQTINLNGGMYFS